MELLLEAGALSYSYEPSRDGEKKRVWSKSKIIKDKTPSFFTLYSMFEEESNNLVLTAVLYPSGNFYLFNENIFHRSIGNENMSEKVAAATAKYCLLFDGAHHFTLFACQSCYYCDNVLGKYQCSSSSSSSSKKDRPYREILAQISHEMRDIDQAPEVRARNVTVNLPAYREDIHIFDPWCQRAQHIREKSDASTRQHLSSLIETLSIEEESREEDSREWVERRRESSSDTSSSFSSDTSCESCSTQSSRHSSRRSSSGDDGTLSDESTSTGSSGEDTLREDSLKSLVSCSKRRESLVLTREIMNKLPPQKLTTRLPRWDKSLESLVLQFQRNRVHVSSSKNLLLQDTSRRAVFQFGKTEHRKFHLDWRGRVSAVQAFAIALSSFQWSTKNR